MARDLGGLVYCFEDQVAHLEATVLHSFVELLKDSLLVSSHSEIRHVPFFLDQIQVPSKGPFILLVIVVYYSVCW